MAGALARYAKTLLTTRQGLSDLATIVGIPLFGYITFRNKKEIALIREQRAKLAEQRSRGFFRVQ